MSEIIKGITNDRLNELFLNGYLARPHEVAVMAGELIEHRKCKDCDGVHEGSCVNTHEAKVTNWWRHKHYEWVCKTENRIIVEASDVQSIIESQLLLEMWNPIIEAEYLAATKPTPKVEYFKCSDGSGECRQVVDGMVWNQIIHGVEYPSDRRAWMGRPDLWNEITASEYDAMKKCKPAAPVVEATRFMSDKKRRLAQYQPCGCKICICESDDKCNGCGPKYCKSVDCVFTTGKFVYEPEAAPVVEPWVQFPDHPRWDTAITEAIYQLQRRLDAVERNKA